MSIIDWNQANTKPYRDIVKCLLDGGATSIAELKDEIDHRDSRIMDACQEMYHQGVFGRARLHGTANATVYALHGTVDMEDWVEWDVAYDDPANYLDYHKPDNYNRVYKYLKNNPTTTGHVAKGLDMDRNHARKAMLKMWKLDILDRVTAIGGKGYIYGLPGEIDESDIEEVDYELTAPPGHSLQGYILDMLELMRKDDRSYWKANHLENEGYDMATIRNALGVMSTKGYIEKWQGDSGPWMVTDKGHSINRDDVL